MSTSQASGDDPAGAPTKRTWREFFDVHSLSPPVSLLYTTTRLKQNLNHFQVNYFNLVFIIFYLYICLTLPPLHMFYVILYIATTFTSYSLCAKCSGSPLDYRILLGLLLVITVLAFVISHQWINLLVFHAISVVVVSVHVVVRVLTYDQYDGLHEAQTRHEAAV